MKNEEIQETKCSENHQDLKDIGHSSCWTCSEELHKESGKTKETETQYLPAYEATQIWLRLNEIAGNTPLAAIECDLYTALTKRFTKEANQ